MKILLSAFACNPDLGSESKVGWDSARAIGDMKVVDECHVMTHSSGKDAIERLQRAGEGNHLKFHFFGSPFKYHPNRLLARLQSWLFYRDWQTKALQRASELHCQYGFTVAQHVTYASWRMPPQLWRLPIPFVFGPVGGGAITPKAFKPILGPSGQFFELLRDLTSAASCNFGGLSACCRHSAAVIAADSPTLRFLEQHGAANAKLLCQVFFSQKQSAVFRPRQQLGVRHDGPLKIFAGGNLEARKGTRMALEALAKIKEEVPFQYTYAVGGSELQAMVQLAQRLGISDRVDFHEGFEGAEYVRRLQESDIFLLPSVRETAGITMMEAMMAGCYPLVLSGTGAGDIVERTGGTAIRAATPEEAIDKIAETLKQCHRNREVTRQRALAAGERVRKLYSEEAYQEVISMIFNEVIPQHSGKSAQV
jgi:glycosyltransferase involved in cell wall biosynthesis